MGNQALSGDQSTETVTPKAARLITWLLHGASGSTPAPNVQGVLFGLSKNTEAMEIRPPGMESSEFPLAEYIPVIELCVELDPALPKAQAALVRPGRMTEQDFWQFYMHHLEFIVAHEDNHSLDRLKPSDPGPERELAQLPPPQPTVKPRAQPAAAEASGGSSNAPKLAYELSPEDFVVFGPRDVHGYVKLPPARASGYAADDWNVDHCDLRLVLRVIAHGYNAASIVLEVPDEGTLTLFGECPLDMENAFRTAEAVVDSSRFFVLQLAAEVDGQVRRAFVGIGFEDRDTSFMFKYELQRVQRMHQGATEACASDDEGEAPTSSAVDLSHLKLKEGEQIKARFVLTTKSGKPKPRKPKKGPAKKSSGVLAPPPSKPAPAPKSSSLPADDFGDFQDGFADVGGISAEDQSFGQFGDVSAFPELEKPEHADTE
eukprot:TRINITY_DN9663_c0_g1_i1.p1 TRINITY_DN9663_c0_g1~~TRINITY_DN9663_c0_g1_i1.p1  ORF type:complete len:431 (-),score=102.56 TRINITY_DN9663_c0_g1_i1:12-1304(-)